MGLYKRVTAWVLQSSFVVPVKILSNIENRYDVTSGEEALNAYRQANKIMA